jgi:hypothetical protein
VRLPAGARVARAELVLEVEEHPGDRPLDVLLYAVKRDWNPGEGGTRRDNTSPPLPGEVWWGERAHGEAPWGFPGAGFASDTHPAADTPLQALAEARVGPADRNFALRSDALARYVEERARGGLPLDFLLKLSDALEDTPDTLLFLYSGNHGDLRNPARRPRLRVEWEAAGAVARIDAPVHLENGRRLELGRRAAPGARLVAASFEAEAGHEAPVVEVRGGRGAGADPWRRAGPPFAADWDWLELRLTAAREPVVIGRAFQTSLHDTWVLTAPPEQQEVRFTFVSPRGEKHKATARYAGDWTWRIAFTPDELGRWHYHWKQRFLKKAYHSPEGRFDVVAGSREEVAAALRDLLARVRALDPAPTDAELSQLAPVFWKLERAVFQTETPESLASEEGRPLRELLTEIRVALSQRKVPEPEAMEPEPMDREF